MLLGFNCPNHSNRLLVIQQTTQTNLPAHQQQLRIRHATSHAPGSASSPIADWISSAESSIKGDASRRAALHRRHHVKEFQEAACSKPDLAYSEEIADGWATNLLDRTQRCRLPIVRLGVYRREFINRFWSNLVVWPKRSDRHLDHSL